MTPELNDVTKLIDRYIAMWNETDPEARRDLIAGSWTEQGLYVDPLQRGEGHDGIDAMVAAIQDRFPTHRFRRTSDVDAHNDVLRFNWELAEPGQPPLVKGLDVGALAGDRLAAITGFLDHAPA